MTKLTYFPIAGRAGPIRICLKAAGIPFEDERIPGAVFAQRKSQLPLGQMPIFELHGKVYCQSTAIGRYAAKKAGLYSDNDEEALLIDEVTASLEEMWSKQAYGGDDLKQRREAFMALCDGKYLPYFEKKLEHTGPFFCGERLTIADLWVEVFCVGVQSGNMDHIPATWLDKYPKLVAHAKAVREHPVVVANSN